MLYALECEVHGWEIHIGKRDGEVVVRAWRHDNGFVAGPYEHFRRERFLAELGEADLPMPLVRDCIHWVNLEMKKIEMRRRSDPWARRDDDWLLCLCDRFVWQQDDMLVGTHSDLFKKVSAIFEGFVDRDEIIIKITDDDDIKVSIPKFDLTFSITEQGQLKCSELGAIVPMDQDVGTLYGFNSMIVLQDALNSSRRDIIFPIGEISHARHRDAIHTVVYTDSAGHYGRFTVDSVLGRLLCPPS
jgi:hypothetical protein